MTEDEPTSRSATPGLLHAWGRDAAQEVGALLAECGATDQRIATLLETRQSIPCKAGFLAEQMHAESFNLDAIVKDADVRALTDRHPGTPIPTNDPVSDIVIVGGDGAPVRVQSKYYSTAEKTANSMRETRDALPRYKDADALLGPSDQLDGIKDSANRTARRNSESRPQVADAAREVERKATDRLMKDGVESKPATLDDARTVARGGAESDETIAQRRDGYFDASTTKHALRAAKSAALVATVVAGSINVVQCLARVQKGEMDQAEAVREILSRTAWAAADGAMKAGAATATVSIVSRTAPALFQGSVFQTSLATGSLGGAAICAVDLAQCLVLVAAGKMTAAELEKRAGMNAFQTGAGVLGASIGAALGAPAGPAGVLVGSFVGGMISSMAVSIAIDNHMEHAYRDTVATATLLVQAQISMHHSIARLQDAERTYAAFLSAIREDEDDFSETMARVDADANTLRRRLGSI